LTRLKPGIRERSDHAARPIRVRDALERRGPLARSLPGDWDDRHWMFTRDAESDSPPPQADASEGSGLAEEQDGREVVPTGASKDHLSPNEPLGHQCQSLPYKSRSFIPS